MKKIFKRMLIVLCICLMLFSISGCVSTASLDDAKPLSANSSYNIDEYEEESVKVDLETGMAFSEKGSVRFEKDDVELVNFWEYGSDKSDTLYFDGLQKDSFESIVDYCSSLELAFEYKNMIYFLRKTYDKQSKKFSYILYRMTLKGEDITKVSTITYDNLIDKYKDEDDFYYLYSNFYYLADVYIQNNTLLFRIYYSDYSLYSTPEVSIIYKIDLKTGMSQQLLQKNNIWLVGAKCDNDFTYLYTESEYASRNESVTIIDNKTCESSEKSYKLGTGEYYTSLGIYNNMMICTDDLNKDVFLLSTDKEPKTIFNSRSYINTIYLLDDTLLIKCDSAICYTYNLKTGKLKEQLISDKINKAVFKVGDKYICFIEDKRLTQALYNSYQSMTYDSDFIDELNDWYSECYYWSSAEDVLDNKDNAQRIKNQPIVDGYTYSYPYV